MGRDVRRTSATRTRGADGRGDRTRSIDPRETDYPRGVARAAHRREAAAAGLERLEQRQREQHARAHVAAARRRARVRRDGVADPRDRAAAEHAPVARRDEVARPQRERRHARREHDL